MKHVMLQGKLHRVVVTSTELHYEGSCAIDESLLIASGISPFEKIEIYNINTGERFETYVIKALKGSGTISLNGAAARKAMKGDFLIICTYTLLEHDELEQHRPKIVHVNNSNEITEK